MNFDKFSFVDIETTGTSPSRDRIIEIGILRVENGKIVNSFESLVNPDCYIPPEITLLTGIRDTDLSKAPTFYTLKDQIKELLTESVFVAHNARFDFSFIKGEYKRYEENFQAQVLCTVKLSRKLFPRFKRHSLDALIERFGFETNLRHRALSDAKVVWDFFQLVQNKFTPDHLTKMISDSTKKVTIPPYLKQKDVDDLPETPGVYIFYDNNNFPLYVGKSINIKDRVISHFYDFANSSKEEKIFHSISSIEAIKTEGELGALILESQLIKKLAPLYNRRLRKSETSIALIQSNNKSGYFTVEITNLNSVKKSGFGDILAVFRSIKQAKDTLSEIANEFKLCKKLLGIEKTKKKCFGTLIGKCEGACIGKENALKYNLKFSQAFANSKIKKWPFDGAVVIKDGNEGYVVDNWILYGKIDESGETKHDQKSLDYDIYKILSKYLIKHRSKILSYELTQKSQDISSDLELSFSLE